MLSFQHAMCLQLQNPDCTLYDYAGNIYPDAIRKYIGNRRCSHFAQKDGSKYESYFVYPNTMSFTESDFKRQMNKRCFVAPDAVDYAIGDKIHLDLFYKYNSDLLESIKTNVVKHLKQDIVFDDFIQKRIDLSLKEKDIYVYKSKQYTGEELRKLIVDIEQYGVYLLAYRLYCEQDITANQKWINDNIGVALHEYYPRDLADTTFSYMKLDKHFDELISNHDWSELDSYEISRQEYNDMYDEVINYMNE